MGGKTTASLAPNRVPAAPHWAESASTGPRTLAERAFEALQTAIVEGNLAPGEHLPIEGLGRMLGMSHLPIREAIRRLEGVGLVTHVPHRGATVTELSLEDLRELYEARLLVEPALIARAATNFHGEDEEAARLALIRQREAERRGSTAEAWAAHTDFHFALYRPSRATWLLHLALPLWNSSQRYRLAITTLREAARRREAHAEHERMLTACAARDGQAAARVLHDHLVGTANVIAEQMGGGHLFERTSHPRRRGAR